MVRWEAHSMRAATIILVAAPGAVTWADARGGDGGIRQELTAAVKKSPGRAGLQVVSNKGEWPSATTRSGARNITRGKLGIGGPFQEALLFLRGDPLRITEGAVTCNATSETRAKNARSK